MASHVLDETMIPVSTIATYVASHAFSVLTALVSLVMALRLFGSQRTSQSMVAWLLAFAFVPLVAIPLFLLLGNRKFPRRAKRPSNPPGPGAGLPENGEWASSIARVLRTSGAAPPRPGNSFELLTTGEAAYARLVELIRDAERSIDLTMFILGDDETGHALVDALAERAARGVVVRMILDAVGSSGSRRRAAGVLGAVGAEVRAFMPLRHSPIRGRTNLRSHRKLCVFDDKRVFAGGMNLAGDYMGKAAPPPGAPRWRDVAAVTSGPVAADATALFESDWAFCGGSRRAPAGGSGRGEPLPRGDAVVQVVASGPDMTTDTVYDLFLTAIFGARSRIVIVTPYYVPDDLVQHALILSARRGVRTELVVPGRSNHRIADFARRPLLHELTDCGVIVHYYERGMVHAKAMLVDDAFAYVGSPNFDMRSLFLNYENALCVYSAGPIAQIRSFVDGLIAECSRDGPPAREHRLIEPLARLFAPEL
jgi:cardiolipin synthase A/B